MIFQGDLSKYHPADALMFLSPLSLNGVLSVALDDRVLTLSFKEGALIDAHSVVGDEKILRMLRGAKFIDADAEHAAWPRGALRSPAAARTRIKPTSPVSCMISENSVNSGAADRVTSASRTRPSSRHCAAPSACRRQAYADIVEIVISDFRNADLME
jgi:hypothetical protein